LQYGIVIWIGIKYILSGADERAKIKGVLLKYLIGVALIVFCSTIASGVAKLINTNGKNNASGIVETGFEIAGLEIGNRVPEEIIIVDQDGLTFDDGVKMEDFYQALKNIGIIATNIKDKYKIGSLTELQTIYNTTNGNVDAVRYKVPVYTKTNKEIAWYEIKIEPNVYIKDAGQLGKKTTITLMDNEGKETSGYIVIEDAINPRNNEIELVIEFQKSNKVKFAEEFLVYSNSSMQQLRVGSLSNINTHMGKFTNGGWDVFNKQ